MIVIHDGEDIDPREGETMGSFAVFTVGDDPTEYEYHIPDSVSDEARELLCSQVDAGYCMYSAACAEDATGVLKHPILGDVPICGKCLAFTERMSAG